MTLHLSMACRRLTASSTWPSSMQPPPKWAVPSPDPRTPLANQAQAPVSVCTPDPHLGRHLWPHFHALTLLLSSQNLWANSMAVSVPESVKQSGKADFSGPTVCSGPRAQGLSASPSPQPDLVPGRCRGCLLWASSSGGGSQHFSQHGTLPVTSDSWGGRHP